MELSTVIIIVLVGLIAVFAVGLYRLRVRATRFQAVTDTYAELCDWLQERAVAELTWIELEGPTELSMGRWKECNEIIDWVLGQWGDVVDDEQKALKIRQ